jgi:hypothetical protein
LRASFNDAPAPQKFSAGRRLLEHKDMHMRGAMAAIAGGLLWAAAIVAQNPPAASALLVENDSVRVSQVTLSPGEAPLAVAAEDVPLLIITLDSDASTQTASGPADPASWSFGGVQYLAAPGAAASKGGDSHKVVRQIWIKLKSAPASQPFEKDAVKLDPAHNTVVFENDRVRVVHLHFPPGESGPVVDKRARVITMLTNSHAIVTRPDGTTAVRDGKAGTVSYSSGGSQATLNAGATLLENVVVELKGK